MTKGNKHIYKKDLSDDVNFIIRWDTKMDKAMDKWGDERTTSTEESLSRLKRGLDRAMANKEFWTEEEKFLRREIKLMEKTLKRMKKWNRK